jgi:hypothetical protein
MSKSEHLSALLPSDKWQMAKELFLQDMEVVPLSRNERENIPLCLYKGQNHEVSRLNSDFVHFRYQITWAKKICGATQAFELLYVIDDTGDILPPHLAFQGGLESPDPLHLSHQHISMHNLPALTPGLSTESTISHISASGNVVASSKGLNQRDQDKVIQNDQIFLSTVELRLLLAGGRTWNDEDERPQDLNTL